MTWPTKRPFSQNELNANADMLPVFVIINNDGDGDDYPQRMKAHTSHQRTSWLPKQDDLYRRLSHPNSCGPGKRLPILVPLPTGPPANQR